MRVHTWIGRARCSTPQPATRTSSCSTVAADSSPPNSPTLFPGRQTASPATWNTQWSRACSSTRWRSSPNPWQRSGRRLACPLQPMLRSTWESLRFFWPHAGSPHVRWSPSWREIARGTRCSWPPLPWSSFTRSLTMTCSPSSLPCWPSGCGPRVDPAGRACWPGWASLPSCGHYSSSVPWACWLCVPGTGP